MVSFLSIVYQVPAPVYPYSAWWQSDGQYGIYIDIAKHIAVSCQLYTKELEKFHQWAKDNKEKA